MVSTINPYVRTLNNSSRIGFNANSNLLVQSPSSHPAWKEPTLLQRAKYPLATAAFVAGLSISSASLPVEVAKAALISGPAIGVVVDNKKKKTQSLAEHEVAGHFGVNCAVRDQVIPTSVQAKQLNPRYFVEQDPTTTEPWLLKQEIEPKEVRFKKLLANALICEGPYALAELKDEASTSFPASTAFVHRPLGCIKYLAKSVIEPSIIIETDQVQALETCWEAAGISARNPFERVGDFIDLSRNLRPTAKALLMQQDPAKLEEITVQLESKNRLNYEELDRIGRSEGLYHNMPELAPRLKAKLKD